jgi:hypothetical protein
MRKLIYSIVLLSLASLTSCDNSTDANDGPNGASTSEVAFRSTMNKLWEDHVVWTRNVILNFTDNLPGKDESVARLLANQDDIGNAIKPYYGDAAGTELSKLLRSHIIIAADVLTAAGAGDQTGLTAASGRWSANADSIATFLSTANSSNWPLAEMKSMMQEHLKLTTDEAVARLNKDFAADIAAYDKVHAQILMMADMLSDGIISQFPDKF